MNTFLMVAFSFLVAMAANANEQATDKKENSAQEKSTIIQMIGKFQMKPESREQFKAAMMAVRKGTPNEPGALAIRMFEDKNNPDLLFGYERFKDFSAVEYHRKQPYELDLFAAAGTTLSAPPIAYVFGPAVVEEVRAPDEQIVDPSELYAVALFDIKPDQFDRVVAQYKQQILNVRQQAGNISFNAYRVIDNPTQLVVVEWWKSAEVAREFSTTDPLSMETGKLLMASLEKPIPEYLHELREVTPTKSEDAQSSDFSLSKKWEVDGFKMPESVFASADHPWLYVSNVNGAEPGFISRVAKDGTVDNFDWATGLNHVITHKSEYS